MKGRRAAVIKLETHQPDKSYVRCLLLIVAPLLSITSAVTNEHQHYCGKSWPDAFDNCYLPCPTQSDSECAVLGNGIDDGEWKCFGYTGCKDKLGLVDEETPETDDEEEEGESSIAVIQDEDSYCGLSWGDATVRCDTPCGSDSECSRSETCYSATNCAVPLIVVKSQLMVSMVGPDQTMDYMEQGIFGETLNDFISDSAGGKGVGLKGVDLGQQSLSLRRLTANVTNIRHRQLPLGSSALDVSVTVTGEFRPPPYIDFDMICEDSINRDPEMVVGSLQDRGSERGRPFFERVQGIEALRASDLTKRPTRTPTDRPTTLKPTASPTGIPTTATPSNIPSGAPSDVPSGEPSEIPSTQPSREILQSIAVGTDQMLLDGGDTSSYGFIFNMRTKPDSPVVIVNGFALFTKSTSKRKFELWSRLGNFKDYKGSLDGWEQIGKGSFKGEGPGIITTLPLDKITPVDIPGGGGAAGTRAFYLTLLSKDLAYNFGQGTESDAAIQIETPEIELWEGEGVLLYPMPDATQTMYYRYPRRFLGSIYYDRLPCRPYSAFGVISKLPCPELPTQSPSIPPPTLSPQTPSPTIMPTLSPVTLPPTLRPTLPQVESTLPTPYRSPAPVNAISPTVSPSLTRMPSFFPSSRNPTFAPILRMQANILVTLSIVPERVMSESETDVFTKITLEFLQNYTEKTMILDAIGIYHQEMVLVDAANVDLDENIFGSTNASSVDGAESNEAYGVGDVNASIFIVNETEIPAVSGDRNENTVNESIDGFAGGFAAGFSDTTPEDEMAGGFAAGFSGIRHRRARAGGGTGGTGSNDYGLEQEKLNKIIAFKLKHNDRGPKVAGVQVTLTFQVSFAYLPESLFGTYLSVIVDEHGIELVRSLRRQSLFYSYFKDLDHVSSEVVQELTPPPTKMPSESSYENFVALKNDEASSGPGFMNRVGLAVLAFWILLTVISITCLYKARLEMKERKKMEDLLSQERSSSKPLIRDQKPEISMDSTQSSDDEQTAESSDPSPWTASKESLIYTDLDSTKSTVSEKVSTNTLSPADGKTVSALDTRANLPNAEVISPGSRKPVPANDVNEAFDDLFGNHDEFKARSSGTSKAAKRKTVGAVDMRKSSTSSKGDEATISTSDKKAHALSDADVASRRPRKPVPANDVNEAFGELFGNHDEFKARSSGTSKAAKRKTVGAVDKRKSSTSSKGDEATVSASDKKAHALSDADVASRRPRKPVPAADVNEAFDELFGNHDEFKARSSGTSKAAKRKTVGAVDKRKPSTSKSEERAIKHKTSRSTSGSRIQASSKHPSSGGKCSHRQNTAMSFMDQVFDIV